MLVFFAMDAGFAGGLVVDWPHSSKEKKSYLVFTCGSRSVHTSLPKAKGQDGQMCSSDDDDEGSNDDQTVGTYGRTRSNKRRKLNNRNNGRAKDWILRKKEQMRRRGRVVPADTKYTGRKRKTRF